MALTCLAVFAYMHMGSLLGPLSIHAAEDYARIRCSHVARAKFNELGMTVGPHKSSTTGKSMIRDVNSAVSVLSVRTFPAPISFAGVDLYIEKSPVPVQIKHAISSLGLASVPCQAALSAFLVPANPTI